MGLQSFSLHTYTMGCSASSKIPHRGSEDTFLSKYRRSTLSEIRDSCALPRTRRHTVSSRGAASAHWKACDEFGLPRLENETREYTDFMKQRQMSEFRSKLRTSCCVDSMSSVSEESHV